jgi:hypothetical protein
VITSVATTPRTLARRLLPLQIGVALQGLILWVPIEKLFMTQIGFDAASVGVMAAAYAAVTPLLEVPSGILADRWSPQLGDDLGVCGANDQLLDRRAEP